MSQTDTGSGAGPGQSRQGEPAPDLEAFYDDGAAEGLSCPVCGCLVARHGDFPRVHWDWHEATNGA
jgi:hypothetical protein